MQQNKSFAFLSFIVILGIGAVSDYARYAAEARVQAGGIAGAAFIVTLTIASAIQVADQWDRAVILRLGKVRALKGPGLFPIASLNGNRPEKLA